MNAGITGDIPHTDGGRSPDADGAWLCAPLIFARLAQ